MDKYIGRLLDNRYEILEVIGTGGMAVVYKARCHRLNRLVAIKILKDDYLQDEEFRRRFHSESQAVAMLSHPNIVSVYDVSTSIMADYIVMELIEGITLKQYMEKKGVLNWKETLHFAIQIAKALEHAHGRGIVHRDIKPHNVMVLKNGSVKVTDFGIARMMSQGNTLTKEALGSVHYISPEQAKGGRVDSRSDIYSLGVVMYEMMAGRPPYDGDSPVAVAIKHINGGAALPSTFNPNIPGGLEQIIMKAMGHELHERYVSATRMLSDMDEFRKDPTILFDYNTPPLDVVTKITPTPLVLDTEKTTADKVVEKKDPQRRRTMDDVEARRRERAQEAKRQQQKKKEKQNRTATIAIICCAGVALIALALLIFFGVQAFSDDVKPNPNLVDVPKLEGEYYSEILDDYPDLKITKGDENYHDIIPAGQIISQKPEAGESVIKGTRVVVEISMGPAPKPILMPKVDGMLRENAENHLNSLGLQLTFDIQEQPDEKIPSGVVIEAKPGEGTQLNNGDTVTLVVSLGKASMPDLRGKTEREARELLDAFNVTIKLEEAYDADILEDRVAKTDPEMGQELREGQVVKLYLSKGPAFMPNLEGYTLERATEVLEAFDLELKIETEPVEDPVVPVGCVVKTLPEENEKLERGQTIKLQISKEPDKKPMPKVEGMDIDEATKFLKTWGFTADPVIEYVPSLEPKGTVINQLPDENTEVELNAPIKLQVSSGPVTMDVTIDLGGCADEAECVIVVKLGGQEIYRQTVAMGTASVTLAGQSGAGSVQYDITALTTDGAELGSWTQLVDFK